MSKEKGRKGNCRKKTAARCVFFALLALTVVCGCFVTYDFVRHNQERQFWNEIRESRDAGTAGDEPWQPGDILPEYRELYERNHDLIGWLKMSGARIDFPVMQTKDAPEYYLRRNFDGKDDISGTPFIDFRCDVLPRRSFNLILYGHYTEDDRLFRRLLDYAYEQWAVENKRFRFDTLEERGYYEVVAAFYYDGSDSILIPPDSNTGENAHTFYNYIELDSPKGFDEFCKGINEKNLYHADAEIVPTDKLLTIVCCAPEEFSGISEGGRFVVVAKKVKGC